MAPVDVKMKGFLSSTRQQFLPIRVKQRSGWVTKFQCIYPGCTKRKSVEGELQPQRLETTYSQLYIHAMRFHKTGLRMEKLTTKEMENEIIATGVISGTKGNDEEGDDKEPVPASATGKNPKKSEGFKALSDWKTLM